MAKYLSCGTKELGKKLTRYNYMTFDLEPVDNSRFPKIGTVAQLLSQYPQFYVEAAEYVLSGHMKIFDVNLRDRSVVIVHAKKQKPD